jgi:hypothetical protein
VIGLEERFKGTLRIAEFIKTKIDEKISKPIIFKFGYLFWVWIACFRFKIPLEFYVFLPLPGLKSEEAGQGYGL